MKLIKLYSYKNISIICENLSDLYKDGLQINTAMNLLGEFPLRKDYKNSIKELSVEIINGGSLSDGFSKNKNLYPNFFIGMISIGERTGRLDDIFGELSKYYKKKDERNKELISASIYPLFLILSIIAISIFMIIFIIPQLEEIYLSLNNDIPNITKFLFQFSSNVNESPIIFLLSALIWVIIIPILILKNSYSRIINFFAEKFKLIKEIREFEVILIIKVIIISGINISLALKYCEEDNLNKQIYKEINEKILEGVELSESLKSVINLTEYSMAMIKLGEESGSLDEKLDRLSERLNKNSSNRIKKLTSMFQPTVIIIMTLLVLGFIGVFILPLFQGMYGGIT